MDAEASARDTEGAGGPESIPSPVASLKAKLDRHPYGALAAALGAGYALGGGIFTPLTARLVRLGLRIGLRVAVLPIVTEQISGMVEEFVRAKRGGDETTTPEAGAAAKA
jgi:hypothetical protein